MGNLSKRHESFTKSDLPRILRRGSGADITWVRVRDVLTHPPRRERQGTPPGATQVCVSGGVVVGWKKRSPTERKEDKFSPVTPVSTSVTTPPSSPSGRRHFRCTLSSPGCLYPRLSSTPLLDGRFAQPTRGSH